MRQIFLANRLCLDDFAGLDTAGTHANALIRRIDLGLYRLEIDIPAAAGDVMRMRYIVAELRLLAANFTDLCHDSCPDDRKFMRMWMRAKLRVSCI